MLRSPLGRALTRSLLVALALLTPAPAIGQQGERPRESRVERWPWAIAAGPAFVFEGPGTLGAEVTLSPDLFGPHLTVGYGGGEGTSAVYADASYNLFVTLGLGVTRHFESSPGSPWGVHGVVGVPLPLLAFGLGPEGPTWPLDPHRPGHIGPVLLYCALFYRPELRSGGRVEHQGGVLLKVRVALTRRQWSRPGYEPLGDLFF